MKNERKIDKELSPDYDWDILTTKSPKEKSIFRKILEGFGIGSLFVGGGILFILFSILQFLFTAFIVLSTIGWAISLFIEGSIFWGLLVLLIGTPLAMGLAHWLFFYLIILGILSAILWGIATILGFDISFWTAWDNIWVIIKIAILGIIAICGIAGFIEAVKEKNVLGFFKDYWLGILLFCFLFWLFFL
ncbi:hypothetical protein E3V08_05135 [Candidatus Atribacteria bacterium MT.SAG.1]|nr:hypothetical protein E3V08_05135 [Candidatus Atribacteria bacterium MT.SAG.1]